MVLTKKSQKLLDEASSVLPFSDEDIIFKGVTESVTDRIVDLKRTVHTFKDHYGSLNYLKEQIEKEGIPADDHELYQDLLEWRAANHELKKLFKILEKI